LDLTINASPTLIDFSNGGIYCEGESINSLTAEVSGVPDFTLDYTLNGNPLSISSSNSSIDVGSSSGEYILNAITDNYCTTSLNQSQTIVINPIPNVPTLGDDISYCSNAVPEAIQATGSTGSYNWYSDASLSEPIGSSQGYTPEVIIGSTTYYVTATENGCEGMPAEVSITFEDCQIIIPTAFTPDDDQVNDFWELGNIDDIYPNNVVSVYNRLGNKVYASDQGAYSQRPWNGDYNGSILPVASYYYTIEYNDNLSKNKLGIVSIIK
jgi:gliding motility-associated-like protein